MSASSFAPRLLAGPALGLGAESLRDHQRRLGRLPPAETGDLIPVLEASGLLGRGGAGFPVGRKWRSVAERSDGRAVVVVNGAEGEPASAKDQALMTCRPHLVLDGAMLAAGAVGADEIVVYVGGEHGAAIAAIRRAIAERSSSWRVPLRLIEAPVGYVAGEQSAAVHFIETGDARPTTPYRPWERGVRGEPTLVQNVESLAHAALIARRGDAWYRTAGRAATPGTALVTVSGDGLRRGVREIELGTPVSEVLAAAGIEQDEVQAVLLGGYFGAWARLDDTGEVPLDPLALRERGFAFGAGVIALLGRDDCGVAATARIMAFMAGESAAQCGPCVFGLQALSDATRRLATGRAELGDLARLRRWADQVHGRGACAHPDGAVGLLASAFAAFRDEFAFHQDSHRCSATGAAVMPAVA